MSTELVGKYYLAAIDKPDPSMSELQFSEIRVKLETMAVIAGINTWELSIIELLADNKILAKLIYDEEVFEGTYKVEGNTVTAVDNQGDEIASLLIEGDSLVIEDEAARLIYSTTQPPAEDEIIIDNSYKGKYYMVSIEKTADEIDEEGFEQLRDMMIGIMSEHIGIDEDNVNTFEFFDGNKIKARFAGNEEVEGKYVLKGDYIYAFEDDEYPIAKLGIEGSVLTMLTIYGKMTFSTEPL